MTTQSKPQTPQDDLLDTHILLNNAGVPANDLVSERVRWLLRHSLIIDVEAALGRLKTYLEGDHE